MKSKITIQFIFYSLFIALIPPLIIYSNLYFYLIQPSVEFINNIYQNLKFIFQETVPLKESELSMSTILKELEVTKKAILNLIHYVEKSTFIIIGIIFLLVICISLIIILNKGKWLNELYDSLNSILKNDFSKKPNLNTKTDEFLKINSSYNKVFESFKKEQELIDLIFFEIQKEQEEIFNLKNIYVSQNKNNLNLGSNFFFFNLNFGKLGIIFIECIKMDNSEEEQLQKTFLIYLFLFLKKNLVEKTNLEDIVQSLNEYLNNFIKNYNFYFNLFLGNIDLTLYHIEFVNVGFQGIIRFDHKENLAQILIHKDILLPFGQVNNFITYKIKINSHDKLLLYDSKKILIIKKDSQYQVSILNKEKSSTILKEQNLNKFLLKLEKIIKSGNLKNDIFLIHFK